MNTYLDISRPERLKTEIMRQVSDFYPILDSVSGLSELLGIQRWDVQTTQDLMVVAGNCSKSATSIIFDTPAWLIHVSFLLQESSSIRGS